MQPNEPSTQPLLDPQNAPPVPHRSKAALVWGVVAVIIVAIIAGFSLHHSSAKSSTSNSNSGLSASNNPSHLPGIAVNTFPYVAACPVFSSKNLADIFGGVSNSSLIDTTYAEDGLPAKDIQLNRQSGSVETSCSRGLGSDTVYAGAAVIFTIHEFPTTSAAQHFYGMYDQTQAQKDAQTKASGVDLHSDYAPLSGTANTVYSTTNTNSYTLEGNKVFGFSAASVVGQIPQDTFKQNIAQAVPIIEATIKANMNDGQSLQRQPQDASFGKKIGDSTIMNPCSFFTGDDFYKANGTKQNPAEVRSMFNFQADTYFPSDVHNGWATNSCSREQYPKSGTVMNYDKVQIQYYKTSDEAAKYARQIVSDRNNDPDFNQKAQEVSGLGDYAAYLKPTGTATLSYLYVQRGPYVLQLSINPVDTKKDAQQVATSQQYQKLAKVLLPKLK